MLDDGERGRLASVSRIVGPQAAVEVRGLERVLREAGPLDAAELLEAGVAHAAVHRRERAQLVPHVLGDRLWPLAAEAARDLGEDPQVVARLARRLDRLAHPLHPTLAVRHGALGLAPCRRGGQHHVGELGGLREEEILHDEQVERLEQMASMQHVGLALRGVLAHDVERSELPAVHRLEHRREVHAVPGRDRRVVRGVEPTASLVVGLDVLEAGELVRDRAHVAAALHVVLPAEG